MSKNTTIALVLALSLVACATVGVLALTNMTNDNTSNTGASDHYSVYNSDAEYDWLADIADGSDISEITLGQSYFIPSWAEMTNQTNAMGETELFGTDGTYSCFLAIPAEMFGQTGQVDLTLGCALL